MYKAYGDIGFGFTKFIDSNGKQVLRPSIYSEMQPGLNGTELGVASPFGDFLFGESAQNISAMPRRFQTYEDCLSDAYAANVLLSIAEMNGGNVVDCELVLSLPYQSIRSSLPSKLIAKLEGSHSINKLGYHKQTINISFPKDEDGKYKWPVMPQNIAPAFVSLAPGGRFKSDATGTIWIGIINVGSKTLELGNFGIDTESYSLRASNQHMTFNKGMYTLADNTMRNLLLDALAGKFNSLTQHKIFEILRSGKIEYGNQWIDLSDVTVDLKNHYLTTVHNCILQNWNANQGSEPGEIYQFCVSGGGAHIIAPYLEKIGYHNNIVVSGNPQFDVCIGARNWHKLIGE